MTSRAVPFGSSKITEISGQMYAIYRIYYIDSAHNLEKRVKTIKIGENCLRSCISYCITCLVISRNFFEISSGNLSICINEHMQITFRLAWGTVFWCKYTREYGMEALINMCFTNGSIQDAY